MPQSVRPTFDTMAAKRLMKATGKSYADLGRRLGMTRQAVGHWFRNRGEPDVRQLKLMAAELGCHWLELVTEDATVVVQPDERDRLERMREASPEDLALIDRVLGKK